MLSVGLLIANPWVNPIKGGRDRLSKLGGDFEDTDSGKGGLFQADGFYRQLLEVLVGNVIA